MERPEYRCPFCAGKPQVSFLQTTVSAFGFDLAPVRAQTEGLKVARTSETRSTCPYCSVSCGVIIHTLGDKSKNATPQVVHVEGDPDHPINRDPREDYELERRRLLERERALETWEREQDARERAVGAEPREQP